MPLRAFSGLSGWFFNSRISSMGVFCRSWESKEVPKKNRCILKRSRQCRRWHGDLHSSYGRERHRERYRDMRKYKIIKGGEGSFIRLSYYLFCSYNTVTFWVSGPLHTMFFGPVLKVKSRLCSFKKSEAQGKRHYTGVNLPPA